MFAMVGTSQTACQAFPCPFPEFGLVHCSSSSVVGPVWTMQNSLFALFVGLKAMSVQELIRVPLESRQYEAQVVEVHVA